MRRILIALLVLGGAASAAAQPRDWTDLHPRVLVDPEILAALPDSIAADPVKAQVWQAVLNTATVYQNVPLDLVFGSNFGFSTAPTLALAVLLAEEPLAGTVRGRLLEATRKLIDSEDVWGSGDDLAAAIRLRTLLTMYDTVFADADSALTADLLAEVRSYLRAMTTDFSFIDGLYNPYCSNHSIGIGATLIQAELCLRDDWPGDTDLMIARILGEALVNKGLQDLLGEDGSYGEGGLYLAYSIRFLAPIWAAAQRLDGVQLWDQAKLAAALEWAAYMLIPDGGICLNRNDCAEYSRAFALHTTLWEWTQTVLPDPRFARWMQDTISGAHGMDFGTLADAPAALLWHRSGPQLAPGDFLPPERFFPDQGLYVYRRGWPRDPLAQSLHFTVQAGKFWGGHWQEDVGHFTLRAFGESFGMDNGPSGLAVETEAHSLPLVDGLGQHNAGESIGTDGTLELRVDRGFCRVLRADMAPAYASHSPFNDPDYPVEGSDWSWGYDGGNPLERADRWVILLPGSPPAMPVFYLFDDLRKDAAPHDYEWRLHHSLILPLAVSGERYTLTGQSGRLDAGLLWPEPGAVTWSEANYLKENNDPGTRVLSVEQTAVDGRFLWQFELPATGEPTRPLVVERYPGGLRATSGSGQERRRDFLAAWEPVLVAPGAVLAGRFGLVEQAPGGVPRALLVDGRELRLDDELVIGLDPAGWAVADSDTVWLSDAALAFAIRAPAASAVMAGDTAVPFTREGDYVLRGDWTGLAGTPPVVTAGAWRLAASGGALPRLVLAGPGAKRARLELFDLQGRRVRGLLDGELPSGKRELVWDGHDERGRRCAAGLYFARFTAAGARCQARLLLLR